MSDENNNDTQTMMDEKVEQIKTMLDFLLQSGTEISSDITQKIDHVLCLQDKAEEKSCKDIIDLHVLLSQLIKPAIPRGIYGRKSGFVTKVTQSPWIVWQMLGIGIFFLAGIVYLSGFGYITAENLAPDAQNTENVSIYLPSIYLLFAAGLGAAFYNLNRMYNYIVTNSYDPRYVSSYWIRLVLGMVAGFMIAQMIELDIDSIYGKPMLALIGGYSVEVVSWALGRFVDTLKTLIQGSQETSVELFQNKLDAGITEHKIKAKAKLSQQIMDAKAKLPVADKDTPAAKALDELLTHILNEK